MRGANYCFYRLRSLYTTRKCGQRKGAHSGRQTGGPPTPSPQNRNLRGTETCARAYTHTPARTHTRTSPPHTHVHARTHGRACTRTRTRTRAHTHPHTHTCARAHARTHASVETDRGGAQRAWNDKKYVATQTLSLSTASQHCHLFTGEGPWHHTWSGNPRVVSKVAVASGMMAPKT